VAGASGAWSRTDVDLTAFAGQRVRLGFYHQGIDSGSWTGPDNSYGWFIDAVEVVTVAVIGAVPPFSDDFEGGLADWSADMGVWEVGTPTAGPAACYSGSQCAGTVLDGFYPATASSQLISAPLDLPAVSSSDELRLRFSQWFSYALADSGWVRISVWDTDSGSWQTWTDISTPVAGASGAWSRTDVDLTAFAGQRVRLGFYHQGIDSGSWTRRYRDRHSAPGC